MTDYYSPARRPDDEQERQRAVDDSGFFNAAGDPMLAAILREAADLFGVPMAAISIVDHERQWFASEIGLGVDETSRAASFCAHTLLEKHETMCIPDALGDGRFAGNPLVLSGPHIRFYTGTPLIAQNGQPLGALCVLDRVGGRQATAAQIDALADLARRAVRRAADLR